MMAIKSRIAPTPSGLLHIGNLYSFVLTWLITRSRQGSLRLRIDDRDSQRFRPEFLDDIFETLQFMGLTFDEGPTDTHHFLQHFSQELRMEQYYNLLKQLISTGLVFACTCTRKQMDSQEENGEKTCHCRNKKLALDTPTAALRIMVEQNTLIQFRDQMMGDVQIDLFSEMPDFIIRKKDGIPAYQLTSLADDLYYEVNLLVRGEDLLASTAAQIYLARLSGNRSFTEAHFFHHPLITNKAGEKLSKSEAAYSIKAMRENGITRIEMLNIIREMPGICIKEPMKDLDMLLDAYILANPATPS